MRILPSRRRLNARIPRDLETICLKCLEKTPNRRYRSADSLAGDLRLWLEGRPIVARRVSWAGHAWRLCRRHPAVAGLLVTLAMTLSTGVVGLFVLLNQAAAERARLAVARRKAEAHEQFSASVADQLGVFLRAAIRARPSAATNELNAALLKLRSSTDELKRRGIVPSSTLGILEMEIGWALMYSSRAEEARDLLNQSATDLKQSLAKTPEDKEARYYLGEALFSSGSLAEEAGDLEAALNCFEQAAVIQMEIVPIDSARAIFTALYKRLQILADRLGQSGRTAQEKRSRHMSQQILRHLLGAALASSSDATFPDLETLRRLFQRESLKQLSSHEENGVRYNYYERFVAEWLALSVGPLSPFSCASAAATYDRDPEAGAVALVSAIRDRCSKLGLADSMVPAAISFFRTDAADAAGEQRRLGRLDDARATVTRLMTIAQRIVREYPDNAHSYRVLSEAYNQVKKNAVRTGDDNLVEESLVQAVEAARRSLALDPDRLETRRYLEKLTEQLASIKADRKATGSLLPQ